MTLTTPSAEALAATYDKLHRLGFKRDEDWFVQHEGLAWEEKIHIDTIAALSQEGGQAGASMSDEEVADAVSEIVGINPGAWDTIHSSQIVQAFRRVLAGQAGAVVPGWQPIETAPKDGRKLILFYRNRNNKARTVMARWVTDEEAAETDADDVGLEGGWYECIDNWDDYCQVTIHEGDPTHWMPLPPPPLTTPGSQHG